MYAIDNLLALSVMALLPLSFFILAYEKRRNPAVVIYFFLAWTFLQYSLAPIITYFSGGWVGYLLKPSSADEAISIAFAFTLSVVVGYVLSRHFERPTESSQLSLNRLRQMVQKRVKSYHVLYVLILSVTLFIIGHLLRYGDLGELFFSSLARGAGQFREHGLADRLAGFCTTASIGAGGIGAILIGLQVGNKRKPSVLDLILAIILLSIAAFALYAKFSRASGILMIVAAFSVFIPGKTKWRHRAFSFILLTIGIYLCFIGISHRSAQPGVGSFILNSLNPNIEKIYIYIGIGSESYTYFPNVNFFDSIAPISAHIYFSDNSTTNTVSSMRDLFFALQPLPSWIFSNPVRFGASLSDSFNRTGSAGITTPALAELYFLFGQATILWGGVYGLLLRRVDVSLAVGRRATKYLIFVLIMGGIVVSGHSGLRAFARPTVLAIILMFISNKVYIVGKLRLAV